MTIVKCLYFKYGASSLDNMLSCAAPSSMQPGTLSQPWAGLLQQEPPVKLEPMDHVEESRFPKEQGSGFYSEGFHSASPSSSSKDSNEHSPRSVGSAGEPSPSFYDNLSLHAKANLGTHLERYRHGMPYNLLTPPGFDPRAIDTRNPSPGYESYPPREAARPVHASTPTNRDNATPPKSPRTPVSPDRERDRFNRFHDSGFEGNQQAGNKPNDASDAGDLSGPDDDFDDEPGLRVPAVNSHGKVKTFKCKQCEFVAVTKLSFWEHNKEHIKPEKMLTCPKCPFVTEYKHHLEYHMRNHFGSKPFQCSQCPYSCVNKSMLNSHLKSHSNIYQYRCADCNYATKYCHSLKLHLRKYQHSPAMVLNMDGTPNPFPIIDVYGTRRGPKQKSISKAFEHQSAINNNTQPTVPPPHPIFGSQFPVNLSYLPLPMAHSFLFPPNNNYMDPKEHVRPTELEKQPPASPSILQQRLSCGERSPETPAGPPAHTPPLMSPANRPDDALDLTSSKLSETGSPPPTDRAVPLTPTTSKNRRKGRAFKLQPAELRLQHDSERRRDVDASCSDSENSTPETPAQPAATYNCQYCDITFGDLTMHTIHMGFHGYNDPFMCNKCGERSSDRVTFFIHLGLAQHS